MSQPNKTSDISEKMLSAFRSAMPHIKDGVQYTAKPDKQIIIDTLNSVWINYAYHDERTHPKTEGPKNGKKRCGWLTQFNDGTVTIQSFHPLTSKAFHCGNKDIVCYANPADFFKRTY